MRKQIIFLVGLGVIVIILVVSIVGYFATRPKTQPTKPQVVEVLEEKPSPPAAIEEKKIALPGFQITTSESTTSENIEEIPTTTLGQLTKPLFEKEYVFAGLIYPYIYLYDPGEGILKYINLDDKTYKELYRSFSLYYPLVSPTRKRIIFQENNVWKVLDLSLDETKTLNYQLSDFAWKNDELYYFAFDENRGGGVYKFSDFNKEPILLSKLNLPEAKMEIFGDSLLVWASPLISYNSPIFLLDLKKPAAFKLIFEEKTYPSLLANSSGEYLFLSSVENGLWVSKIYNRSFKVIKEFNWGSLKEKCTFQKVLVCGVPINQETDLISWYHLNKSFNDKIIIFDPVKKEEKEIILDKNYDVLYPQLTPLGVIFLNRNDSKLYLVTLE